MNRISSNFRMAVIQGRKTAAATKTRDLRAQTSYAKKPKGSASRVITIRPIFICMLFLLGSGVGYQVGRSNWQGISRTPPDDLGKTFEPFWETWNLVQKHYVDQSAAQNQHLTQGAIKGL